MEAVESKVANESVEVGIVENGSLKENGGPQEPIKFGSHGPDEPVKGDDKVSEVHMPKNAVDEWPEPKQIHSFWFVKYRSFEDQKLKAKFEQSDKDLQKKHQSRSQLIDKLRVKKGERSKIISELKVLGEENKQYWSQIDDKRKEIEPLQQALGQLRGAGYGNRDRVSGICSSEQELNDVIKSLQYRIQHESIPLNEEKQILREIKQLEATRPKVVANSAVRQKIQESMGEKDALQDQVKLIGVDLDDVRKNQKLVKAKVKQLDEIKEAIDNDIRSIEEELTEATEKRDKTFESIHDLRKQREEVNLPFYENRSVLNKAKELAAKKDVEGLRDFSEKEVGKFISLWSNTKAFREDYGRRILPSLDSRQMSRDGRIRNPGEKPILSVEPAITRVDTEVVPVARESVKQPKEPSSNSSQIEALVTTEKDEKENVSKAVKEKNVKKKIVVEDDEDYYVPEKKVLENSKEKEIDEKKLKQMKREEEKAKAKQALERKKKLAEKAAAKAASKAQKEAEKKEKEEREKKLKKAGASVTTHEPEEQSDTSKEAVSEQEKVEDTVETTMPDKNTDRKNAIKYRKRPKGLDSLPKTLIKRKKATNYVMWASVTAAAAVAVILVAIVGFKYLV